MKKVLLLSFLLGIFSCSRKTSDQTPEKVEDLVLENTEPINAREVPVDKVVSSRYSLEPATEEDFSQAVKQTSSFTLGKGDARKVKGAIHLKIKGEWMPIKTLKDTLLGTDDSELAEYKYLGQNKALNKYLVAGYFYEHYETYLIDKLTGSIAATTWTEPSVSTDLRFLANVSPATIMDQVPNGIQVWEVTKKEGITAIEKYFEIDQQDWEAFEIKWESPRSIIVKMIPMGKYEMLAGEPRQENFSYLRLKIKEN